jgi:hypothetical protein
VKCLPKIPLKEENVLLIIQEWETKWKKLKQEEINRCYNEIADVCSRYPSPTVIVALELVKAQLISAKLNEKEK